jgi:hypothetical protein
MSEMLIAPGRLPGYLREPSGPVAGLRFVAPVTCLSLSRPTLDKVLRVAAIHGAGLGVEVDLLAVQVIHFLLPLEPDSRTRFLSEKLQRIAADSHIPVTPVIVLARDTDSAFTRTVPRDSVMLVAAGHWFSPQARLARRLLRLGYDVLVAPI